MPPKVNVAVTAKGQDGQMSTAHATSTKPTQMVNCSKYTTTGTRFSDISCKHRMCQALALIGAVLNIIYGVYLLFNPPAFNMAHIMKIILGTIVILLEIPVLCCCCTELQKEAKLLNTIEYIFVKGFIHFLLGALGMVMDGEILGAALIICIAGVVRLLVDSTLKPKGLSEDG